LEKVKRNKIIGKAPRGLSPELLDIVKFTVFI